MAIFNSLFQARLAQWPFTSYGVGLLFLLTRMGPAPAGKSKRTDMDSYIRWQTERIATWKLTDLQPVKELK